MLNAGRIEYTVRAERDDECTVRGNALASGDDALDRETEDGILARLADGDVWAWAHVTVTATLDGFSGDAHLGACSYEDEDEFRTTDYYTALCNEAREHLGTVMGAARRALHARRRAR